MTDANQQRYRTVLKSSSLIGGSAFINIFIGMIRTKFVAVLLGPAGVGLANMYATLLTPLTTVAGMGLNSSGVREIAEANGRNDSNHIAVIARTLRKTVWVTGIFGCLITAFLSPWLSWYTFHNFDHTSSIVILSISVLLANITLGWNCILQGTRRILDIAKVSIYSAIYGTIISIPCYYLWAINGIVPSLVLNSIAVLIITWWFTSKVIIADIHVSWTFVIVEAKKLLSFGLPVMSSALLGACSAYLMRLIIMNQFDLDGVGIWSAAFNISGVLVNFVLNAMSTDYYPRLTGVAHDNTLVEKEVNAQIEIALLLATPALMLTILFAPVGIELLYSGKFNSAIPVLRWSVYGILGRVISWPLGFIILAKGRAKLFLISELTGNFLYLVLIYLCGKQWGLPGTGIAFLLNYAIYIAIVIVVAHFIAQTHFSNSNVKLILLVVSLLILSSCLHIFVPTPIVYYAVSGILFLFVSSAMMYRLAKLTGINIKHLHTK